MVASGFLRSCETMATISSRGSMGDWRTLISDGVTIAREEVLGFEDGPSLDKCLDPVAAVLASDAGVLESTPRRLRIVFHAVDHDAAGAQLRGHAACALDVRADDGGVKPILRIVGDSDCVVLRVVSDHTEYG